MNVSISQAMACGLPVVATRHSGFPEQIVDGVTGILVPEGDWRALAHAMIRLIEHPELWTPMGRAGHERVMLRYDHEKILDRQIAIYQEYAR